jgi:hypothetical protein
LLLRRLAVGCTFLVVFAIPASAQDPSPPPDRSPLSWHIGDTELRFGGFMDATLVSRDVYTGNGLGTAFGSVPFSTTSQAQLAETRLSAQNSRLTLLATGSAGSLTAKGYLEVDFLGNAPPGMEVTSNSNTLRMRLYWAQIASKRFEFLAGQSWSLLTPNRSGLSPMPADVFFTENVDTNYQMGLTWTRAMQFRVVARATDAVAVGVSIENPQQYVGTAVVLPSTLPGFEVDTGGTATNVPSRYPDIIGKIAFDPSVGGRRQHVEAAALVRGFATYNPTTATSFTSTGTGAQIAAVLKPADRLHVAATAFLADGGGRYVANTNLPDFIVNGDGSIGLVNVRSFLFGPELQAHSATWVYAYYSEARADAVLSSDGKQIIGFGTPGSTASNRRIAEASAGVRHTFFLDHKMGGLQLMLQYSRVERWPFSVPAGTPTSAAMNMAYVNVRYVLP